MDCAALVCRSVPIVLKMHIENVFQYAKHFSRICILRLKTCTLGVINDHHIFVQTLANGYKKTRNFLRISNTLKNSKKGTNKRLFAENLAKQS